MPIIIPTIAAILTMRVFITVAMNTPSLQFIFYDQSFHLYYGVILMILALFLRRTKLSTLLFGIGAGLFIDDVAALTYIITGPTQNPIQDYWSSLFIIPLLFLLLGLVIFEKRLQKLFTV